jgi:hypothetical protein
MNADMVRENLAYRVFLGETLGRGEIAWWSPYLYGGIPFAALNHTQVLYPPMWLAARFDPYRMYGAMTAFHFAVAGLGMFLWLRVAGVSAVAGLFGAVAFMLNGMFATRHGHPQFLATGCWLPFVLAGTEWLRGRRVPPRPRLGMLLVAAGSALAILAGHPSIYLYGFYFVGAYLVVALFVSGNTLGWRERRWLVLHFGVAFAIGVALASAQLLATAELSSYSERSVRSLDSLSSRMPHWSHLLRLVFPDLVGNPIHGNYLKLGQASYTAGNLYLGVAPLLLACIGVVRGGRLGAALAGIALSVLAIIYLPAAYRIAYWLPGFQFSRIDRLSIAFFLSASFLAALGLDALLGAASVRTGAPRKMWARALGWGGGVAGLGVALGLLVLWIVPALAAGIGRPTQLMAEPDYLMRVVLWGLALWIVATVCISALHPPSRLPAKLAAFALVALAIVDLAVYAKQFVVVRRADRLFRSTPATDFLEAAEGPFRIARFGLGRAVFPANVPMVYGIEDLNGFGPMHLGFIDELLRAVEHERLSGAWAVRPFSDPKALESPVLDLLQVRYVLSEHPLQARGLREVHRGDLYIYENSGVYQRAFFVPERALVDSRAMAADLLASGTVDARRIVLLERDEVSGPLATSEAPAWRGEGEGGRVEILSRDRERWVLRKTGPGAGYVVLAEPWYPGWRAEIDGREVDVLRADVMLRAVAVESGDHRIEFAYRPSFLPLAGALTAAGSIGLIALLVLSVRESRAERASALATG